ncbi:hypothetical protein C0995_011611, partial [Termitomyces sp. Mi166
MIIDTKSPPPPYVAARPRPHGSLSALPPHLLLRIIYLTFPPSDLPGQRKTLSWLSVSLRLVDCTLYTASMHVLRSTHIPLYDARLRQPYTSDPFPQSPGPLASVQRETAVLDRFIALKVREDVWADDSELHLDRDEAYKDLFDHAQPRARLEDLVRLYGIQSGVVNEMSLPQPDLPPTTSTTPAPPSPISPRRSLFSIFKSKSTSSPAPSPSITPANKPTPIPIADLSIALTPRSAGLVLSPSRRTIVSTPRTTDEPLEDVAKRLVKELQA